MRRAPAITGLAVPVFLCVLAPLIALFLIAFQSDNGHTSHLAQTWLGTYVLNSLGLAVLTALGTLVLGGGLAALVGLFQWRFKPLIDVLLVLPLALPAYVMAYAWEAAVGPASPAQTVLREATGWRYGSYIFPEPTGVLGAAFLLTLALYPYVYLTARTAFSFDARAQMDLARVNGAGPWRSFFHVALPLARPVRT